MELGNIRDELLKKQTLDRDSMATSKNIVANFKKFGVSISNETIEIIRKSGYDISFIKLIDFNRLSEDEVYLEEIRVKLRDMRDSLKTFLEGCL